MPSQPLPLGRSDFATLRTRGAVYVDKTHLVCRLAEKDCQFFLSRPHRFGKSLLLSTFASLFRDGLKHFHGLAAESIWQDRTYPVVHLDFSILKSYRSHEEFTRQLQLHLAGGFGPCGFNAEEVFGDGFMFALRNWLLELADAPIVLLIDEYDAPLTSCINRPEAFDDVKSILSQFYGVIKSADRAFRFVFITGITKFQGTTIFSELNNLQDLTLCKEYGELVGYTEDEIRRYFPDYIKRCASVMRCSEEELLKELKTNYDGYCFEETCTKHVFAPWSVLNFFEDPQRGFAHYWYLSGGQPAVLLSYLTSHTLSNPQYYDQPKAISIESLLSSQSYEFMEEDALLVQTGYLTLKSRDGNIFKLRHPNKEVATAMAILYSDELLRNTPVTRLKFAKLPHIIERGRIEEIAELFNLAFASIDYNRYPIRDEASCRAYLHVLLLGAALLTRVEMHSALGRSDLEADVGSVQWVFEIKFVAHEAQAPLALEEALRQMESRRYGSNSLSERLIRRAALVFNGEERRFTLYEEQPSG